MLKENKSKPRIMSLDMFRGFAIFGMILVNYLGHFETMPDTFRHPRYGMTFANAIAPYFLFAVGMGLKLSLEKRIKIDGTRKAYWHAAKRYLILILIGIVVYGPDPVMDMWDALVDIGFAGLITLPFIASGKIFRTAGAFVLLIIYQLLFIFTGYGEWTMPNSIDGGPLGPISWASILVFGTIQMDYLKEEDRSGFIRKSLFLALPLLFIGLGLSYLHPKEFWEFSQRSMTVAYPIFASGLSVITFLAFYLVGDVWKLEIPHLVVLGMNPLVIYIIQQVLIAFYGDALPKTAQWWQALLGFAVIYGICYLIARYLIRKGYFIKI
jgi:predicted acyltransferase